MTIRIHYFPNNGYADPLRMMMEFADHLYIDDSNITEKQWAAMKNTPAGGEFNQLPHYYLGNDCYQKTMSVMRAVGASLNFYN